jgi:hypothetical protein
VKLNRTKLPVGEDTPQLALMIRLSATMTAKVREDNSAISGKFGR